jgi:hypothetical protein
MVTGYAVRLVVLPDRFFSLFRSFIYEKWGS